MNEYSTTIPKLNLFSNKQMTSIKHTNNPSIEYVSTENAINSQKSENISITKASTQNEEISYESIF
jgi:hypothetical protein